MPGEDMENEEKCKMISFQIPITCLETTKLDDRENDTIMSPKQSNPWQKQYEFKANDFRWVLNKNAIIR